MTGTGELAFSDRPKRGVTFAKNPGVVIITNFDSMAKSGVPHLLKYLSNGRRLILIRVDKSGLDWIRKMA